jgi:hypothetical protein
MKTCRDSLCSGRDSNSVPPEHRYTRRNDIINVGFDVLTMATKMPCSLVKVNNVLDELTASILRIE